MITPRENKFMINVWLEDSNQIIPHKNALGYQEGNLYCVWEPEFDILYEYPLDHIVRIEKLGRKDNTVGIDRCL